MNTLNIRNCLVLFVFAPLLLVFGCQQPSLTPGPSYATYALTVNTVSPVSGVAIVVSYSDLTGATDSTASFTRNYNAGTVVVLTAPTTAGGNNFTSWTGCTSVTTVTCTVTVASNIIVSATYTPPPNYILTVGSTDSTRWRGDYSFPNGQQRYEQRHY